MTEEEFKNLEVDKTFKMGNKTLIVKEAEINDCTGCFFYENRSECEEVLKKIVPACASWARKDKKSVIFKEFECKEMGTILKEVCSTVGTVSFFKK